MVSKKALSEIVKVCSFTHMEEVNALLAVGWIILERTKEMVMFNNTRTAATTLVYNLGLPRSKLIDGVMPVCELQIEPKEIVEHLKKEEKRRIKKRIEDFNKQTQTY